MKEYESPIPDIMLAGDFNFPKATWEHGIGEAVATTASEKKSLQLLIDTASKLNLLQKVCFGTRITRLGNDNTLELIFTNNHELISNIYSETSELTDHKYITCETSHHTKINSQQIQSSIDTNLASYNYLQTDWEGLSLNFNR